MLVATATRNAMVGAAAVLMDAGSAAGAVVFRTSASAEVAALEGSDPFFGAPASGVVTADTISPDTNAAGGTTDRATLEDSAASVVVTASVGTSGADIIISSTAVGAGDTVSMSSLTMTMPAGSL